MPAVSLAHDAASPIMRCTHPQAGSARTLLEDTYMTDMNRAEDANKAEGSFAALLETTLDSMEEAGIEMTGIATGFRDLDALTHGLQPGHLTVIASRPGMGRTAMLSGICRHAAIAQGHPTSVFTFEDTPEDFGRRLMAAEGRVALHRMRSGTMADEDWIRVAKRVPDIHTAPLTVHTPASMTLSEFLDQAREDVRDRGARLIAVDGLQDIRPDKRNDLREREVGDTARALKTLARELRVPVVATSHLNRGPEQRYGNRPQLDDLRESGAVTYAADMIILLFREDAYEKESPRAGEIDLIIARNRYGPECLITAAFQQHYGRLVDMAPLPTHE